VTKFLSVFLTTAISLSANPLPDFKLVDVNETSPRSGKEVSPRNYQHKISVYYFGAST
jgi:hypothetical protein